MIEGVDPALKSFCVLRSIKEARRDAQSIDPVAGVPGSEILVSLARHVMCSISLWRTTDDSCDTLILLDGVGTGGFP